MYPDALSQFTPNPTYRALVVEDDPDTRDALCRLVRRLGWIADAAGSVRGAIAGLARAPDAVILDLRLSDGSGLALLRQVRDRHIPIPVALLTGVSQGDALADAVLLRPDALFTKPADLTEIAAWLRTCQADGRPPSLPRPATDHLGA